MSDYCEQNAEIAAEMAMVIKVNDNTDIRRYNDAIQTDVAAIFRSTDGAPPFERNMIVFSKNSNGVRSISVLHPSLDPFSLRHWGGKREREREDYLNATEAEREREVDEIFSTLLGRKEKERERRLSQRY